MKVEVICMNIKMRNLAICIGGIFCIMNLNSEYHFTYMNTIQPFLFIFFFICLFFFKESILYPISGLLTGIGIDYSLIQGIINNPSTVPIIFDSILSLSFILYFIIMLFKRRWNRQNQNMELSQDIQHKNLPGDGTISHPYRLDIDQTLTINDEIEHQYHKVMYALNGGSQEYEDPTFGFKDKVLVGKKHLQQDYGGFWKYESDMPALKENGTLWMKGVVYLSHDDVKNIYQMLCDDHFWQMIQENISHVLNLSYKESYQFLIDNQIPQDVAKSLLKVIAQKDNIFDKDIIKSFIKFSFQKDYYQEAMDHQDGMIYCAYCIYYYDNWFLQMREGVWKVKPTLYEPSLYYGKGTYQPFEK